MQFEKCLTCPAIKERKCAGPNFMTASTKEVVEWMLAYQKLNGITNAQWAAASGVPKGTVDGLKNRCDVRHDTLYPLIRALIEMTGGKWGGEPCAAAAIGSAEQKDEIAKLTMELEHAKDLLSRSGHMTKWLVSAVFTLLALCLALVGMVLMLNL